MKLLCINNKEIVIDGSCCYGGEELTEGEVYTTRGKPFKSQLTNGKWVDCYYIDGIGARLAMRFTELVDGEEEEENEESFIIKKKKELLEQTNLN
jgi:hypothetical protein